MLQKFNIVKFRGWFVKKMMEHGAPRRLTKTVSLLYSPSINNKQKEEEEEEEEERGEERCSQSNEPPWQHF